MMERDVRDPGTRVRLKPRKLDAMFDPVATRVLVDEKEEVLRGGRTRIKRTYVASSERIEPDAEGVVVEHSVPWDSESEFESYVRIEFLPSPDSGPPYGVWRHIDDLEVIE